MTGYVWASGRAYPNSYVSDGRMIRIDYHFCRVCEDAGVLFDHNGEPSEWCECSIGEAVRQNGNPGER